MGAYIVRRLLLVIPTLFAIMVVNFAVVQVVPGGPIEQILAQPRGHGGRRHRALCPAPAARRRRQRAREGVRLRQAAARALL
jgi:ABC-type microcin C transport system permease subunit YejB